MKRFIILAAVLLIGVMTLGAEPAFKIGLVFDNEK